MFGSLHLALRTHSHTGVLLYPGRATGLLEDGTMSYQSRGKGRCPLTVPKECHSEGKSLDLPFSSLGMGSLSKDTQLPEP